MGQYVETIHKEYFLCLLYKRNTKNIHLYLLSHMYDFYLDNISIYILNYVKY